MLTKEQNELLCRVEGAAAMGRLMRSHWLPVCMSEEVAERDGAPVRARLLGEDLVVFRDSNGRLGVLDEHCPHRGASLAFGRNEACGLRCLYHGWKFDVEGSVLDMSSEPEGAAIRQAIRARAYPVREGGGFVWIWMGPIEQMRGFEPPAWAPTPETRISIVKIHAACNWAQVLEGSIDSAHSSSLHSTNMPSAEVEGSTATDSAWLRPSTDKAPRMQFEPTGYGFRYAAIRKPILNPETHQYVRTTLFIAPFTVLIPPNDQYRLAQMLVPIDDLNTMFYWVAWHPDPAKGISQEAWRRFCAATVGVDLDENYRKKRNLENRYLQDREAMKRGDFTGIQGIPTQDMAMWESMGAIADRSRDKPGTSDVAVVQFRRMMVAAAKKVQEGGPAIGTTEPRIPHLKLASFEGVVPKTTDWRTPGAPEESAVTAK
ncbi:MAG TPA: Rieske 2Fe-2S domain-containing protein [Burkholderiales bacterium]|jgi:phthalate 4,5-dioxygenase oxygenase subunit|nr:Rieske 2Fe-2S domain-containing protein [Burkholderiales bacterium]